jgi:catechol 2,3-dioxygenase-like lactoylglutathione lyase family enzyme
MAAKLCALALAIPLVAGCTTSQQAPAPPAASPAAPQPVVANLAPAGTTAPRPLIEGAHFHHVHFNSVDPQAAIAYYTKYFDAKPARFAGIADAVWTQKSWLLFTKVAAQPSTAHDTAIWHIGWGAPDPKTEFRRQTALGNEFYQPLTDISTGLGGRPDRFYYMYVQSPDGTWIELNTARTDNFGHLHLFSADPIAAGDWYIRFFGATGRALSTADQPSREPRMSLTGTQVGPSSSLYLDNVNLIIYPMQYSQKVYASDWGSDQTQLEPTRGNVNDHVGVSVPNLDTALRVVRDNGITITQPPRAVPEKFRYAFIEGPDRIAIELIEDHTEHPPEEQ